jgi:NAD(P)-dependent dehydrogenase (short-subunit alcohol dehydrogenase family)
VTQTKQPPENQGRFKPPSSPARRQASLEIARKLAVEGAYVIITGRNKAKLDQAVDSIRASDGAGVSGVLADASADEGAAALVQAAPAVDILVNNLGIYELRDFAAITDKEWRRYFEVNVLSGA